MRSVAGQMEHIHLWTRSLLKISDKLLPNWEMMEMRSNEPAYLLRPSKVATCPVIVISFGNLPSSIKKKKKKKERQTFPGSAFPDYFLSKSFSRADLTDKQDLSFQVSAFPYHDNVIRPLSFETNGRTNLGDGIGMNERFLLSWCLCVLSALSQTSWSIP